MKILQLNPTVVIGTQGQVFKIFKTELSREAETAILNRTTSPILSALDTGEQIRIVETTWHKDNILALKMAKGNVLSPWYGDQKTYISLVASLLAKRHSEILSFDGGCEGQLLGDFIVDHLFWDKETKTMTFIDPGANYLVYGDLGEDCARYMYSVFAVYRWRPLHATKLVTEFVKCYLRSSPLDKANLEKALEFRYGRSVQKFRNQKTAIRAVLATLLLAAHKFLISRILRRSYG